jgi:hypothetical protein
MDDAGERPCNDKEALLMTKERSVNEEKQKRDLKVIKPIYDRAGRACATKGQKHLGAFEEKS